jgi:hypothetical protein
MMTRRIVLLGLTGLLLLFLAIPAVARPQAAPAHDTYDLTWNTLDGAGGTLTSLDGVYTLTSTAGQPEAGQLANGYTLKGGFWNGVSLNYTISLPLLAK